MADINGTPNNDTLLGTAEADRIFGGDGQDIVSGEGASDLIDGGAGDDVLYGDAGVGTAQGRDATPITLDFANRVADTGNNASVGDSVVYRDVAQLADGTAIWGRLILVATSDSRMPIDLTGGAALKYCSTVRAGADMSAKPRPSGLSFLTRQPAKRLR